MKLPELPPITLPADLVVPAWRNAYLASGSDSDTTSLYRTVCCEWYPDGMRFTSTDGFVLVSSYAAGDREAWGNTAPDHDEAPLGSVTAIAADRIMTDFLKHRATEVKAYRRSMEEGPILPPVDVTFSIGTIDEPDAAQQRLDLGDENQHRLIISTDAERIALPLHEGEFPNWRAILGSYKPAPRAKVQARADLLRRIGQLDSLPGDEGEDWLQLTMANNGSLIMVQAVGRVPVEGAFTPRREESAEVVEDEAA